MSKNKKNVNDSIKSDTENDNDRRQFVKTVVTGAGAITFAKLIPDASAQIAGSLPAITTFILDELPLDKELTYGPGDRTINIPPNANYMRIDAYGAGGGGSAGVNAGVGSRGGNGGHTGAYYELEAIDQLILSPGEGGGGSELSETASGGVNGGASGGTAAITTQGASGGGGGGYSSVFIKGSESAENIPLLFGAGGGGAGGRSVAGSGGRGGRGDDINDLRDGRDGSTSATSLDVNGEGADNVFGGAGAVANSEFGKPGLNSVGNNGGVGGNHTSMAIGFPYPGGAGGGGGGGFLNVVTAAGGAGGGGGAGAGKFIAEIATSGGGGGGGAGGTNLVNSNETQLPGTNNYYTVTGNINTGSEGSENGVGGPGGNLENPTTKGGDGGDGSVVITFYSFNPVIGPMD